MPDQDTLLLVRDLKKHFPVRRGVLSRVAGYVKAVDGVSFSVRRGSTLGLVGESGCGKTTVGRTLLRLLEPTSGQVLFDGVQVDRLSARALRPLRRRMQIIFQDPYGSLNPRMTVEQTVGEPLTVHGATNGRDRRARVGELLERVGLSAAYVNHYPHEFSGGQRQRIGIARALALNPDFIVCDEPVSALDVSIQAQIINLLADLQEERGLSYLFISHDLGVVEHIAHDVAVMYLGQLVEVAPRAVLYRQPLHPYTQLLLAAIPSPKPKQGPKRRSKAKEQGPALQEVPASGCRFYPRCALADEGCSATTPELREVEPGHFVRCIKV
ncbi:MAG: ABC transporter ATP-binding protein [Planctomycetota bacterium]|jgi:oligopeptide/dipeptide ABC transporter ATP-binding protein